MENLIRQFIDFAQIHAWKQTPVRLPSPDDMKIILAIVQAAGFDSKWIAVGKLHGQIRDQDGPTGETYLINPLCPFKLLTPDHGDDYRATAWLEQTVEIAAGCCADLSGHLTKLTDRVERSRPLPPILLNSDEDLLGEYPSVDLLKHSRDSDQVSFCAGVHLICRGWIDRHHSSAIRDALTCRRCGLRISFPKTIQTYGELRTYLASGS